MNTRKRLFALIFSLFFCVSLFPGSSAHPVEQYPYISWGESTGWSIDEGFHTNGTALYFKFDTSDPYLSSTYKKYATDGAALWNGTVSISQSSSAVGTVHTGYYSGETFVAAFCNYSSDSSGHLTSWKIVMNRVYASSMSATVLAHELGHAIGLNDLYNLGNKSKLMYVYTGSYATAPTASDIKGAKVITGQHSAHTWSGYKFHSSVSGNNQCCRACTACDGWKAGDVRYCAYNLPDKRCIYCGTPKGISMD